MTTITEDSILKNPLFPQNVDPLEISLFHFEKDISEADIDVNTKDKLRYVMRFVYDTLKELNIGFKDPLIQFVKKSLKYNNSLKNLQNYFTSIPSEKYFSNWTEIQKICYIIYYNLPYSRNFTNNNNLKNNISDILNLNFITLTQTDDISIIHQDINNYYTKIALNSIFNKCLDFKKKNNNSKYNYYFFNSNIINNKNPKFELIKYLSLNFYDKYLPFQFIDNFINKNPFSNDDIIDTLKIIENKKNEHVNIKNINNLDNPNILKNINENQLSIFFGLNDLIKTYNNFNPKKQQDIKKFANLIIVHIDNNHKIKDSLNNILNNMNTN